MKKILRTMAGVCAVTVLLNTVCSALLQIASARLYYGAGIFGKGLVITLTALFEAGAVACLFVSVGCVVRAARIRVCAALAPAGIYLLAAACSSALSVLTAYGLSEARLGEYTPAMFEQAFDGFVKSSLLSMLICAFVTVCAFIIASVFRRSPARHAAVFFTVLYSLYLLLTDIISTLSDIADYGLPESTADYASLIWVFVSSALYVVCGYFCLSRTLRGTEGTRRG